MERIPLWKLGIRKLKSCREGARNDVSCVCEWSEFPVRVVSECSESVGWRAKKKMWEMDDIS
jgi:hypothetical protein